MPRPSPPARSAFRAFVPVATRWRDDDRYGHVNNVVYYTFFDTAVNRWLTEAGLLDLGAEAEGPIGLVVRTECDYFTPLSFPQALQVGLAVEHLGTSSVGYRLGVFAEGTEAASAAGRFTHVCVDRASHTPHPLPGEWRTALAQLTTDVSPPS